LLEKAVLARRARGPRAAGPRPARGAILTTGTVPPKTDAAKVAALLRRQPEVCMACVTGKLDVDLERVVAAVEALGKTITWDQTLSRCTVYGRLQWVLALAP